MIPTDLIEPAASAALARALEGTARGTPFLTGFLGIEPHYDGEITSVDFDVEPQFCNRRGVLHGGIIALLFDITMGNQHRHAHGSGATVEIKVQYLHAIHPGRIRCEARFLKKGKRVSFIEGRMTDGSNRLVAMATGTWTRLDAKATPPGPSAER